MSRITIKHLMKNKFYIYLSLTLAWMVVIFLFSAQNANESSTLSNGILLQIVSFFHIPDSALQTLSFLIRKCAHATEYGVLAILFYLLYGETKLRCYQYPMAILSSFLYACTDEFHQLFVPGRAGMLQDVLIDTFGAVIALVVVYGIVCIQNKNKE